MSNVSRLRRSLAAAALPDSDSAGAELARLLAALLDDCTDLPLGARLEAVKVLGPQYLRTLNALGLTRAGRPVGTAGTPTVGSAQGVSADAASHDRHRARFAHRGGAG